jgi:hypothetical protein
MSGQLHASTTLPSERAPSTVRLERLHAQSGPFGDEKKKICHCRVSKFDYFGVRRIAESLYRPSCPREEAETPWRILNLINTNGSKATWRKLRWSGRANLCFYRHGLSTVITALECNVCCGKNVCIICITRSQWEVTTGDCVCGID